MLVGGRLLAVVTVTLLRRVIVTSRRPRRWWTVAGVLRVPRGIWGLLPLGRRHGALWVHAGIGRGVTGVMRW